MKILIASSLSSMTKTAWDKLTAAEKKEYIKKHPNTKWDGGILGSDLLHGQVHRNGIKYLTETHRVETIPLGKHKKKTYDIELNTVDPSIGGKNQALNKGAELAEKDKLVWGKHYSGLKYVGKVK